MPQPHNSLATQGPSIHEAFDEAVVGRPARPGEVEHDTFLVGPQVEVTANEFRALVHPDGLRIARAPADPFERGDHVLTLVAEPRIHRRREPREGVDDGQHPDLAAGGELVVDEVHRPGLIAARGRHTVLAQLRLHPAAGHLVAQLQPQLLVKAVAPLWIIAVPSACFSTKAICASENFDAFMELSSSPSRGSYVENSSSSRTKKPGARQWRKWIFPPSGIDRLSHYILSALPKFVGLGAQPRPVSMPLAAPCSAHPKS